MQIATFRSRSTMFGLGLLAFCSSLAVQPGPVSAQNLFSFDTKGLASSTAVDRDGDGLKDTEEVARGLDPLNADTDGDALLDGWEVNGVNGIDLAALGANPRRKDIFIEMDFMVRATATNGLAPSQAVIRAIRDVFASAPVDNPDGTRGITLHLELDDQIPHDPELFPTGPEFQALKAAHFDANRLPVFHYMIWADTYKFIDPITGMPQTTSSGNSFDIPNSDFIVTLGAWNSGSGGTDAQKIGTFIHELGHNLGLRHGGSDNEGYKANHLSVMNYRWQTRGVIRNGQRVFDYQRLIVGALREPSLSEPDGLESSDPTLGTYHTAFVDPAGAVVTVPAGAAIDWNRNGNSTDQGVAVDLNGNGVKSLLTATPNEWLGLVYNGGAIGSSLPLAGLAQDRARVASELRLFELTEQDAIRLRAPDPTTP